jgi:dienelactone hydrolase
MLRTFPTALLALALACASGSTSTRPATPPRSEASRAYDAKFPDPGTPLEMKVLSTSDRSGVSVVELTYAGASGRAPVQATLVRPPAGSKRGPAVLWVHWLGEPATTNRTEFVAEAVELAQQGAVSLLVEALWSQPNWYKQRTMDEDPAAFTAQVISLRRGLDLLTQEPGVDPARLAVVGHDFGGMTGMLAAAADGRPRSQVLLAMTPRFEQWMFYDPRKRPTDEQAYRQQLAAIAPIDALPALEGATLIQLANEDFYVPPKEIEIWRKALAGRGELRTYATSHAMEAPQVRKDRQEWLQRTLGLPATKPD